MFQNTMLQQYDNIILNNIELNEYTELMRFGEKEYSAFLGF